MPPILKYLIRRLLTIPLTLLIVTASLYGLLMLAPPEERATLYMPQNLPPHYTEEDIERLIQRIIENQGLDDPFPIQYTRWLGTIVRGNWGYSPILRRSVLPMLLARLPVSAELAVYSVLTFIPLGLLAGVAAARRHRTALDDAFRLGAFVGTSLPPFVLGLLLLAIFYVGFGLFGPWRLSISNDLVVSSSQFRTVTGLLTVDGILNGRPDISLDALAHLLLPVLTLSLSHWATLGRLTRAAVLEEMSRNYIVSARARGLPSRNVLWRHALRNALIPALNSTALSAASLITGVFVVERVFAFHGLAELVTMSMSSTPDVPLAVGFAVISVLLVLPLMLILDVFQAIVDPRVREGIATE